jgi:hypothetical protein
MNGLSPKALLERSILLVGRIERNGQERYPLIARKDIEESPLRMTHT